MEWCIDKVNISGWKIRYCFTDEGHKEHAYGNRDKETKRAKRRLVRIKITIIEHYNNSNQIHKRDIRKNSPKRHLRIERGIPETDLIICLAPIRSISLGSTEDCSCSGWSPEVLGRSRKFAFSLAVEAIVANIKTIGNYKNFSNHTADFLIPINKGEKALLTLTAPKNQRSPVDQRWIITKPWIWQYQMEKILGFISVKIDHHVSLCLNDLFKEQCVNRFDIWKYK